MTTTASLLVNNSIDEVTTIFMDPDLVTEKWWLTRSIVPIATLLAAYLLIVMKIGPSYMKEREGYKLEQVLRLYNIVQIVYNGYLIIKFLIPTAGVLPFIRMIQVSCTFPNTVEEFAEFGRLYMDVGWKATVLKAIDLLDTVFMILRKKSSQVTFLHIYHHVATVFSCWYTLATLKAPQSGFLLFLNAWVHVVMYLYYFLTTFDSLKPYLWWKQALTKLQLGQFVLMLSYMIFLYCNECMVSEKFTYLWVCNVIVVFVLFINFYFKAYVEKPNIDTENNKKLKLS